LRKGLQDLDVGVLPRMREEEAGVKVRLAGAAA
jgi:hypothetical protein